MRKKEKIFGEVRKVTQELIRCGLAEEYNFPVLKNTDIIWENYSDISLYLKNMEYMTIYKEIEKNHNFNIKLPDGGILQFMYRFDRHGTKLQSHRLAFYPSPSFEIYQNDADLYDADYIYGDILNKNVLPVIIRADYSDGETDSGVYHPYCHVTLGEYKNCRIPVDRPISPVQFVKFVMEHFYYVPSSCLEFDFGMEGLIKFDEHIAERDMKKTRIVV